MWSKAWGIDKNGIPTNGRIVYAAVVTGICMAGTLGYLIFQNGFSWFLIGFIIFLYIACISFLVVRVRNLRKNNVEMVFAKGPKEGFRNAMILAGGFKTLLKFAFVFTGIAMIAVLIKVIIEI